MSKIAASAELATVVALDSASPSDLAEFVADPAAVLFSKFGVDTSKLSVAVVENSADSINLTLPYYDSIKESQALAVDESSIADAAGGEVFIMVGLIVAGSATAGTAIAAGTAAAVTHGGK